MIERRHNGYGVSPAAALLGLWLAAAGAARSAEYDTMGPQQANDLSNIQFLKWGPFDVHPTVSASARYDDNIYINTSTNIHADFIWIASPGVVIGLGDYLAREEKLMLFHCQPSFIFFTDQSQNNNVNQDLSLFGQWRISKLTLGLRQDYQTFSEAYADVGNRVNRTVYTTELSGKYELGGKTSLNVQLRVDINDNEGYLTYNDWIDDNSLTYQISEKLNLGLGLTFGYRDSQDNRQQTQPDETYEQISLRGQYRLTGKLDFRFNVGGELRQFTGSNNEGIAPVFSLGLSYQPFDATTLGLEAYQRDQNSIASSGQNYTTTGFTLSVRQRFFQKYFVTLSGGYESVTYRSTTGGTAATRSDDYFFVRNSVDWSLTAKWTVGMFYQYRQRDSSDLIYNFKNNQVGLHTSYSF